MMLNSVLDTISGGGVASMGRGRARTRPAAMSYLLTCPNCGIREVTDFAFGGEVSKRPSERPTFRELNTYTYIKRNVAGVQREWWNHRSGCRAWFLAERNTVTNEVLFTALPAELRAREAGGES